MKTAESLRKLGGDLDAINRSYDAKTDLPIGSPFNFKSKGADSQRYETLTDQAVRHKLGAQSKLVANDNV